MSPRLMPPRLMPPRLAFGWTFLAVLILTAALAPARAQQLVADLSAHQINITAGFSGADLLLFGVSDGTGDVVVIVSGPDATARVRKKERVSGLWINTASVRFDSVPSFYHVAATDNLSTEDIDNVLRENGIGLRYQNMSPIADIAPEKAAEFRDALIRRKEAQGLYSPQTGKIEIIGGALFRTKVAFPATVPTGTYRVYVYQVADGWVRSVTEIPLRVGKVGLEETVYRFAHDQPALYGLFAIAIAALAGYGAGMLFGRR
jgi:uncharacterized protein (TIGR02186 family)